MNTETAFGRSFCLQDVPASRRKGSCAADQVSGFVVLPKRWIVDARTMSTG